MPSVSERKYVLTKLGQGDYLLPSNDAKTLWRLKEGWDDSGAEGKNKRVWRVYRYEGDLHDLDVSDWDLWELYCSPCATRKEAIGVTLDA